MTAIAVRTAPMGRSAAIALGLVAAIAGRWALTVAGLDGLAVGLLFGLALLLLTGPALRISRPDTWSVAIGLASAAVLIVIALVGRPETPPYVPGGVGATNVAIGPWVAVTVLVATAEELALRGRLFDAVLEQAGAVVAVATTSMAFALMHVPFYGWHVVPLDLGVGIWFGGLRLLTGGVAAPAIAHVLADLATRWL